MNSVHDIIKILKKECKKFKNPIVTEIGERSKDPFKVLISCVLSLRTKDAVTAEACKQLFRVADTPQKLMKIHTKTIERLIYPVGFYKTKAKRIKKISKVLIQHYNGRVPSSMNELLKFKGVGRKCANLVLGLSFNIPSICVDTHVHRISNRLGFVKTKTPEQTEYALMKILPKKYWAVYNDLLVSYGQNICVPVSPFCSRCVINQYCPKIGVKRFR